MPLHKSNTVLQVNGVPSLAAYFRFGVSFLDFDIILLFPLIQFPEIRTPYKTLPLRTQFQGPNKNFAIYSANTFITLLTQKTHY